MSEVEEKLFRCLEVYAFRCLRGWGGLLGLKGFKGFPPCSVIVYAISCPFVTLSDSAMLNCTEGCHHKSLCWACRISLEGCLRGWGGWGGLLGLKGFTPYSERLLVETPCLASANYRVLSFWIKFRTGFCHSGKFCPQNLFRIYFSTGFRIIYGTSIKDAE